MTKLLIEKNAYDRVESEIRSIRPDVEAVILDGSGNLWLKGEPVAIEDAKPEIAWLSVDLISLGLMETFADFVLRSGSVKWMQTFNAGLDRPFYREIFTRGIRISNSDAQAVAIAEYVLANVMTLFQKSFERKAHQDAHRWQKTTFRELWRSRWLIVGFGNIGRRIAGRLKGFDCHVTAVRRTPESHPDADEMIALSHLPSHLPQADVVVLACSLNEETRGLAGRDFFQKMRKGSVFVNIARGALVDPEALAEAIKRKAPQFAVLDVFDPEPLPPESPLWALPDTILTPHSSHAGSGTRQRGDLLFTENLQRFLAGKPLRNEILDEKSF